MMVTMVTNKTTQRNGNQTKGVSMETMVTRPNKTTHKTRITL